MPRTKKIVNLGDVNDRNTAIEYINKDIVNVKLELQTLNKLVRDGNGQPSLLQQVSKISSDLTHLEVGLKEELNSIKEAMKNHHEYAIEKNKTSWQFKSAVWVALITSLASVFIHMPK